MTGYIDRYHNGVETRTVHFNGKTWNVHRPVGDTHRSWHSVSFDNRQRYPRTYGTERNHR
jgi:hypothetical protein